MTQFFPRFPLAPTDRNDLFQVARDFLDGVSANFSDAYTFNPVLSALHVNNPWVAMLASVTPDFHGTLYRCINANLRSFKPTLAQLLNTNPMIGLALARAKTDRSDIRILPTAYAPLLAYSYYASLADTFGTPAVQSDLAGGALVLVGIRMSSSTIANSGRGSYDDAIVVVKGVGMARTAITFPACTEPGAQYSQRAQQKPGGKPGERVDARYSGVTFKKAEGIDMNGDQVLDAGRLVEGTYQYTEKSGGHLGARAFRVGSRTVKGKKSVFTSGPAQVAERDTDGDGRFNAADLSRIDPTGAGTTMYIHQGGADNAANPNTW
jgi:hypothetical protein